MQYVEAFAVVVSCVNTWNAKHYKNKINVCDGGLNRKSSLSVWYEDEPVP